MQAIGAEKVQEIKEDIQSIQANDHGIEVSMQCVAFYVIDFEYSRSTDGDAESLLSNQDFIIASIIWSYIHTSDDKLDEQMVNTLDEDQLSTLKYWQQPMAVVKAMRGGAKAAGHEALEGAAIPAILIFHNFQNKPLSHLPLHMIAGATYSAINVPKGFKKGFQETYAAVK